MVVIIVKGKNRTKAKIIGCKVALEFVDLMGTLAGVVLKRCIRPGADVKRTLIEASEKVLIPAFLEGAGCTLKEEYK